MADVFISHSSSDREFAEFLQRHLVSEGLTVFLAPLSLTPGQKWPQEILNALKTSTWVFFLASRAACESPWVQQELGAAMATQKKLVPITWDTPPSELPGWIGHIQALDLRGASADVITQHFASIADAIKADKAKGMLIGGLLVAGLLFFLSKC